MNNPYLDEYFELGPPSEDYWASARYEDRRKLVAKYSWAVPTTEAINELVSHSPLIEIGAGTGYWASLVQQAGGDIVAYDKNPPTGYPSNEYKHTIEYVNIHLGGPNDILIYPNRTLFLCWPPYADSMAYDCLRNYSGKTFIYVGEGGGGCTGDDKFHKLIDDFYYWEGDEEEHLEPEWVLGKTIHLPQWPGVHDNMYVYRRIK